MVVVLLVIVVVRKVTQQHRVSQDQLSLEKQRLDTAINNLSHGLMLCDSESRVVVVNQSYVEMYRLHPGQIRPGHHFRETVASRHASGSLKGNIDEYCADVLRNVKSRQARIVETEDGRTIQIWSRPVIGGGWVATHEDITERKRADEKIARLAHFDTLTGLPNRTLFSERLANELVRSGVNSSCALIFIDIDQFKGINDSLGHPVGDELLRQIAERIDAAVGPDDLVARLGGDEFAVIVGGVNDTREVVNLVEDIHSRIRSGFDCDGHQIISDASIGIAISPQDGTEFNEVLKNADLAMYAAKSDGRRTYRFFSEDMKLRNCARRKLELDLHAAAVDGLFAEGGFEVYYQPILRLDNDDICGCEALLRWRHPDGEFVSPVDFIPVAEESGLICQIGEWVLNAACAEATRWPSDIKVAVNVSPVQFRNRTFALIVASALARTGLRAERLELEITEAVLIRDDDAALTTLHQLRDLGVRIALDDFGTGYSSLSYLERFPFDKIKIDRSFVTHITRRQSCSAIVQAVVGIAAASGMTTTAEGVETLAQKGLLKALGCGEMQGYLFSSPKRAKEIAELLVEKCGKAYRSAETYIVC